MNRRYVFLGVVTLVSVFACCILSGQYALKGCFWWECSPKRDFHILNWELPSNLFPEGAIVGPISPPSDGHGEIEGGGQDIYIGYDVAVYEIYRFPSARKAILDFERMKKAMVDPTTGLEWLPPNNLVFSSATADDLHIACGYFHQYRCETAARYQEYVVFFGAMMSDKLTYAEFEKVIAYIDEQISSRLYP